MRRFQAAAVARQYVAEYLAENPGATIDEARAEVGSRLNDDFGASPWLELILKLLLEWLPLIFASRRERGTGIPGV